MMIDNNEKKIRARNIVEEYGGIFFMYEAFYIEAIRYSAGRCIDTFKLYQELSKLNGSADEIASLVQEALSHAASISRFFWPMKEKNILATRRGKKLCTAFKVLDTSPLKNRALRNAIEHYDEKLDDYLLSNIAGNVYPYAVVADHATVNDSIDHTFRLIDPTNSIAIILGVKYDFGDIFHEVEKILKLANIMMKNGRLNVPDV